MKKSSGRIFRAGALLFYCGLFIYTVVHAGVARHDSVSLARADDALYVRILIDKKERSQVVLAQSFWSFSTQTSFIVSDIKNAERRQILEAKHISVGAAHDGCLMINGRRLLSDYIKIESTQGPIKWGKYTYNGSFYVIRQADTYSLINCIELEEYVESGLRWEMLPGWPAATLEAGAIAYRTYAVNTLTQKRLARRNSVDERYDPACDYDIGSTWMHQVYRGVHTCQSIRDAVEKTRGLIIAFDSKPISAMYHACCGGSIPSKRTGIDFNAYPYLSRAYPCRHCKKFKCFSWKYSCSLGKLSARLAPVIGKESSSKTASVKKGITDVAINTRDAAGFVRSIVVRVGQRRVVIPTSTVRELIGEIKSGTFVIKKKGKCISFEGKGFGHQLGFCQWGACGLGQQGWGCSEILHFYYPKTVILNLSELKEIL